MMIWWLEKACYLWTSERLPVPYTDTLPPMEIKLRRNKWPHVSNPEAVKTSRVVDVTGQVLSLKPVFPALSPRGVLEHPQSTPQGWTWTAAHASAGKLWNIPLWRCPKLNGSSCNANSDATTTLHYLDVIFAENGRGEGDGNLNLFKAFRQTPESQPT